MQAVIRLRLKKENVFMGKGVKEILYAIEKLGSIKKASEQTGISYPKIMRILQTFKNELGFSAVSSKKGGNSYGGTHLTEKGKAVLECFCEIESEVEKFAQKLVQEKFDF